MILLIGDVFKIKPAKSNIVIERIGVPFKIKVKNVELQNNVNKNSEPIEIQLEEELITGEQEARQTVNP